jgi:ABC-type nitrate/sulfonate/bicarbonate transport system ATPase subunit
MEQALCISLTLDMWSEHRRKFLLVTVHSVESATFRLSSDCLELTHFPESHTGAAIASNLMEQVHSMLPLRALITVVTTDGAADCV